MIILGFGVLYLLIGRFFPNPAEHQFFWRLGAWGACGVVFLGHVAYEHVRLRASAAAMAFHVAAAVAVGALGLAIAGPVLTRWSAGQSVWPAALAVPLWPVIAALPAYVVARAIGFALRLNLRG